LPIPLPEPEKPLWTSRPRERSSVSAGEVHVWRADIPPQPSDALRAANSAAELRYAERMTSETARRQFIAAQAALRLVLELYLREPAPAIGFRRGDHGKPFLLPEYESELQFNLTHSHDRALVVVALGTEIGVDIEKVRERPSFERLAARFYAEQERAALAAAPVSDRERVFLRLWTRKEAHLKATGTGLSVNLKAIDTLAPAPLWWYHEFAPADDYVASLAGTGDLPRFTYHTLGLPT
jgi:4'-phosphopantetheinyl transferase